MHFSISLFCACGEILWKIPVMECFCKFACNDLQLWTTAAEKLYIITALINMLNNNFCWTPLEYCFCAWKQSFAVVLQNRSSEKFRKFHRKTYLLEPVFNKVVKNRLQHRCYFEIFAKFLRTLLSQNTFLQWLPLCVLKIWEKF